ncbi:hypothetical protein PYCCODRAFT_1369226 [Trametes coccinea BRFM310]|uniref:Malate dehydrogenase n=1 Tax=Trametes coccinea (strain BRFM310) TaxID=1353009 RepID=A0A1Y2ILD1_TRAC3|nr:hypothetical protein PYCCODRAFT_1369226 [Trametes coccinea BRFM310]
MVAIVNALFAAAAAGLTESSGYDTANNYGSTYGSLGPHQFQLAGCSINSFVPQFPSGQTQLVAPSQPPKFIGLAFGVQNYTCSSGNNFTSTGAVAELIDVSCIASTSAFSTIQNDLFNFWTNVIPYSIQSIIDLLHILNPPEILAQHYFVPNPTTGQGLSPKWDFTSSGKFKGVKDAFIIAKGKGTLPSPNDPTHDVAWLDVVQVEGDVASEVFRFDTVGGQPPSSCTYGKDKDISVKYVSKYSEYHVPQIHSSAFH